MTPKQISINNRTKFFEGKTKILYKAAEDFTLVQFFKDDLYLDNGKRFEISGKGSYNNSISSYLMSKLDVINLDTHFIEKLNMKEQLIQMVEIIPISVQVNNLAYGRYVTNFGLQEGYLFDRAIIDFVSKSPTNSPVNENQMLAFEWVTKDELKSIKAMALRVHDFLTGLFIQAEIRLVSCSLEFGKVFNGEEFIIMLADEISP
jgi:phosphoribosylaminoimidazole-succinocarboxamide synthase